MARPKRFELLTPWFVVMPSLANGININELDRPDNQSITEPCGSVRRHVGQKSGSDSSLRESIEETIRYWCVAQASNTSDIITSSGLVYLSAEARKTPNESMGVGGI